MRRREFLAVLSSSVLGFSPLARAQSSGARRIAVLMDTPQDQRGEPRLAAFIQSLSDLGWTRGEKLEIEVRWGGNTTARARALAAELLSLRPDVILASASPSTSALIQSGTETPVVFVLVTDPVGAGFVNNLARPGGNVTGFTLFEYSIAGKWLELLKELSPDLRRVGILRDAGVAAGAGQFGVIQAAAGPNIEVQPMAVGDRQEIEQGFSAFSPGPRDGVIVTATPLASISRETIISLANRFRVPTVFPYRHFVLAGGLASYGPDLTEPFRRAATYVSRILQGEKPSNLPVQAPTNYSLAINMRTAASLGLNVPSTIAARADEVIE